ncbi:MAG: biopolymer transporter ExbD [Thermosynechococcaceae cyanobacterium]
MRFRKRQGSEIPEVNLIPLMDVLMSVLTFFIIISMTLTGQQVLQVELPASSTQSGKPKAQPVDPLVVGLTLDGSVILEGKPTDTSQLFEQVQAYLGKNPDGNIILSADRKLPYARISDLLKKLGKMGGDHVSLLLRDR